MCPRHSALRLEELRTDTQTFTEYVDARRNRHEEWFKVPAGHVDVCNVPNPNTGADGFQRRRTEPAARWVR